MNTHRKQLPKRVISLMLTLALLLGMLPTVALAARDGEVPSIIEYKAMSLVNLQGGEWLSRYEYAQEDNTFYSDVNLNIPSLLRIGFTIEKSQNVSLALYELKDSAVLDGSDGYPHAHLEYYFDPEAPDFGASVPEDFLGTKIGYINGVRVLDNIVDPDPNAETVQYNRISEKRWAEIIQNAYDTGLSGKEPMVDMYAFGFKGQKLPEPAAAMMAMAAGSFSLDEGPIVAAMLSLDAETLEDSAPVQVLEPDADAPMENEAAEPAEDEALDDGAEVAELPAGEEAFLDESPVVDEAPEVDAVEPLEEDEELPAEEDVEPDESAVIDEAPETEVAEPVEEDAEEVEEEEPTQPPLLPISDVLYDPYPVSTFSMRRAAPRASAEWAIENYILWDGSVVTESGSEVQYDFHDGYYVIVLEPSRADAAVYNSFLGFASTTEERTPFSMDGYAEPSIFEFADNEMSDMQEEILGADDYDPNSDDYDPNSDDPVSLLTGSFNWNYTDIALYGDEDLSFTRYYESTSADKNFGLGNGWTTNFTADLNVQKFFAEVHLTQNRTLYFDMDFDGEYRTCGDWTFCWNGNGYTLENTMSNKVYTFDGNELLTSITQFGKEPLVFTNDGTHITSVTKGANQFTFGYNASGNLSSVTDSVGRTITLSYDGDFLTSVENPDGDSLRYTYTADGFLETVKNFKGQLYVENTYDTNGRVVHQYAADMGTFDFTYDVEGHHNTCTGTDGYLKEIRYDEKGRVIENTDATGTVRFSYNDDNQITSKTNREGNTTSYEHDAAGNISKVTYADGTSESFVYDANRRVTAYTDRNGVSVARTYDANGNVTSVTDGRGNTTSYTYSDGFLSSVTDPEGNVTHFTNDAKGNRTSMTDAKGGKTTYAYDSQGRLVSQTSPDGSKTEYAYTAAGKLVKITDAQGSELTYTVDGNGFNTSESDWMGHVTTYERNTQNQITKITDPMGNATTYSYDDRGNMVVTTDANGNRVSYTYDAAGRMVSMTDGMGNSWSYAYDNESRLTSVTDPLGGVASTSYDEVGRSTSTTDANGAKTSYTYDGVGNTTAVKDALGKSTKYAYDANGNVTSMTNRNGDVWKYTYDANDRLVSETDALGGVTTYT